MIRFNEKDITEIFFNEKDINAIYWNERLVWELLNSNFITADKFVIISSDKYCINAKQ